MYWEMVRIGREGEEVWASRPSWDFMVFVLVLNETRTRTTVTRGERRKRGANDGSEAMSETTVASGATRTGDERSNDHLKAASGATSIMLLRLVAFATTSERP